MLGKAVWHHVTHIRYIAIGEVMMMHNPSEKVMMMMMRYPYPLQTNTHEK